MARFFAVSLDRPRPLFLGAWLEKAPTRPEL
jgi:hypothetical protein